MIEGRIVTPEGLVLGCIHYGDRIDRIEVDRRANPRFLIVPSFVDLHVHGGGGFDVMHGVEAVLGMARFHMRHGTNALLATTLTAPRDDLVKAFEGIAEAMLNRFSDGAAILGVHLEGPFISREALGAQPDFVIPPDLDLLRRLHAIAPIKVATYAPEIDPEGALLAAFLELGIKAQIGHTLCTVEQARQALEQGASGFTHLFNAMSAMHHREPGCVGAALAHARHAELILDGYHVSDEAARAAIRAIPCLYGITDAVAAAGMGDGIYTLGNNQIRKQGDRVRLADGTLAGSVLTMDRAFLRFAALRADDLDAVQRTSAYAAEYLGLDGRGHLTVGAAADFVMFERGRLVAHYRGGEAIDGVGIEAANS